MMPKDLLNSLLKNEVALEDIFQWLTDTDEVSEKFNCLRGEFVSYFLNFVHNEIAHLNTTQNTTANTAKEPLNSEQEFKVVEVHNEPKYNSNNESTPKHSVSIKPAFTSPISPLYNNNHTFTTPKFKNDHSICLGDFLVNRKSSNKKKSSDKNDASNQKKRINPTNVTQRKCTINLKSTGNSYSFKESPDEYNDQNLSMLEVKDKISVNNESRMMTRIKTQLFQTTEKPSLKKIMFKDEVDKCVNLYTFMLKNNLVINVTSEIYYLLSLLISDNFNVGEIVLLMEDPRHVFQSIHNTLYFITQVLFSINVVLLALGGGVLIRNLYENKYFKEFCKCDVVDVNTTKPIVVLSNDNTKNIENVVFDMDTDNRENFPSDASFHAFRKQRDLFYDILRIWEQNHVTNWNFSLALSGKIKTLFNLSNDSDNFRHMAKLFKAQLLRNCRNENYTNETTNEELSFLSKIANVNADKLNRLKTRLHTKQTSCGVNPVPEFSGYQEFYQQFITISANYVFLSHLKDALIFDITELNNCVNDNEDYDTASITFKSIIKDLKLLSKFLGFIDSLPYKLYNEKSSTLQLRLNYQPNFDLKSILRESITSGTFMFTIPWIVSYLSVLDYVTLRLCYYRELYEMLFTIYLNSKWGEVDVAIVVVSIGWLLELPHFPTDVYFTWLSKKKSQLKCLNKVKVVDNDVLYTVCPYLEELKNLFITNITNKGITVKHITPLSTKDTHGFEDCKLKLKLEESFLNGQPMSTRKTIDFVSERVASACIKHICNKIVPDFKKVAANNFKSKLQDANKDPQFDNIDFANKCLEDLMEVCRTEIASIRTSKIKNSIDSLLAVDELEQTKNFCTFIANKMCNERVEQWITVHVNKDLFLKIFESLAHKSETDVKPAFVLPSTGRSSLHNPDALSAVKSVQLLRSTIWKVLNKDNVPLNVILCLLDNLELSFTQRCDINDAMLLIINKLSLELSLLYITHNYQNVEKSKFFQAFTTFWKKYADKSMFSDIMCPRNVMLLAQSMDPNHAWSLFSYLINILLKHSMLNHEQFEEQCVAMYKQDWNKETLEHLSNCFQEVVSTNNNASKFNYLLNFLSGYCYDLNENH